MSKAEHKLYAIKLNTKTDADCIKVLDEQENKQAFIKHCIREEIHNGSNKVTESNKRS